MLDRQQDLTAQHDALTGLGVTADRIMSITA